MQDYSTIVEQHARQLGATIRDLNDLNAISDPDWQEFAAMHSVQVLMSGHPIDEAAFSDVQTKQLFVALPIKTELGCMIAMHELGHIATTEGPWDRGIECESKATQWALDNLGFTLSPAVARKTLAALSSYERPHSALHAGTYAFRVHQELEPIAKQHA